MEVINVEMSGDKYAFLTQSKKAKEFIASLQKKTLMDIGKEAMEGQYLTVERDSEFTPNLNGFYRFRRFKLGR
jgi:hypothetical protein